MTMTQEMEFRAIHNEAVEAGELEVVALEVEPMIVTGRGIDGMRTSYYVEDGVCGFAKVVVSGTSAYGKWAKAHGLMYPKGLSMWVSGYNQSLQRKEAFAKGYTRVLVKHGIEAHYESRMD